MASAPRSFQRGGRPPGGASSSTALAITISLQPAPSTVRVSCEEVFDGSVDTERRPGAEGLKGGKRDFKALTTSCRANVYLKSGDTLHRSRGCSLVSGLQMLQQLGLQGL